MDNQTSGYGLRRCPYRLGVDMTAIGPSESTGREWCSFAPVRHVVDLLDGHQVAERDAITSILMWGHCGVGRPNPALSEM